MGGNLHQNSNEIFALNSKTPLLIGGREGGVNLRQNSNKIFALNNKTPLLIGEGREG